MPTLLSAAEVLDREFLDIRAQLLQLAAALDRIDRAEGSLDSRDPRSQQMRQALRVLAGTEGRRAERIQLAFSLPYDSNWRDRFGIGPWP